MSTSNIFSNVFIYGNCTVQGTFTSLGGSAVSQWTTSGSVIYYSSGNVGIGTAAPVSTFEVTGTGFPGTALTRTAAGDNYGVGIQYSLISNTGSFRGYYARAFGGSLGTIATTNQNQANGYFGIDVANAGLFASDTYGYAGVQFYVAPTISVFNTRVGIGTTNPGSLLTVSGGVGIGSGYNAFTAPTNGMIVQGGVGIGTSNPGVNALQVTGNVVTSGFTSNATNTVFNYDTLTVPFLNATQVGIGVTTPAAPLTIYGATGNRFGIGNADVYLVQGQDSSTNGSFIQCYAGGNSSTIGTSAYRLLLQPYGSSVIIGGTADNGNRFQVNGISNFTGNVGIGTASPVASLHVTGQASSAVSNIIIETGTSAIGQRSEIRFGIPAFSGTAYRAAVTSNTYNANGSDLQFWTNASSGSGAIPQMTILPSGNVGIGATFPGYTLDVSGIIRATANIYLAAGGTGGTGTTFDSFSTYQRIQSWNSLPLALNPLGNNVGIGTTNPTAPLHLYTNSGTGTGFWFQNASGGYNYIGGTAVGTAALNIRDTSGQWLQFYYATTQLGAVTTNGTYLGISGSPIYLNGNVGIGSTSPTTTLDVNGTIRTSGQATNALILYFLSTCFTQQVSYVNTVDTSLTLSSAYIPAAARAVLADVFIAPGLSGTTADHEVFNLGSVSNGTQKTWVEGWGTNPNTMGTLNNQIVRLLTDGENGGGSSFFMGSRGIWFPSLTIPIAANGVMYYSNFGNSGSSGYIYLNVKGYYM